MKRNQLSTMDITKHYDDDDDDGHFRGDHRKLSLPPLPLPPTFLLPTVKLSSSNTYHTNQQMTKSLSNILMDPSTTVTIRNNGNDSIHDGRKHRCSSIDYRRHHNRIHSFNHHQTNSIPHRSYPNLSNILNKHKYHFYNVQQNAQPSAADLSLTKCLKQFPQDYLPYATKEPDNRLRGRRTRSNSFDVIGSPSLNYHHGYHRTSSDSMAFDGSQSSGTVQTSLGLSSSSTSSSDSTRSTILARDPKFVQRTEQITEQVDSLDESSSTSNHSSSTSSLSSSNNKKKKNKMSNVPPTSSSLSSSSSIQFDSVDVRVGGDHHHHRSGPGLRTYPQMFFRHYFSNYPPLFRSSAQCGNEAKHHDERSSSGPYGLIRSCGCCLLIMLAVLILLSLSIVLGFSLYLAIVTNLLHPDMTFAYGLSGNFKVTTGDNFTIRLLNQSSMDFRKKAARYEKIIQKILEGSLLSESILHNEIYTFRHGSLIVFFRFYSLKPKFDELLSVKKSKTIINFGTIENVYLDDEVILARVRQVLRDSFKREWPSVSHQNTTNLSMDLDTVKITSLERLTEAQYRDRIIRKTKLLFDEPAAQTASSKSIDSLLNRIDLDNDPNDLQQDELAKDKATTIKISTQTPTTTLISTATISTRPTSPPSSSNNLNTPTTISTTSTTMKPSISNVTSSMAIKPTMIQGSETNNKTNTLDDDLVNKSNVSTTTTSTTPTIFVDDDNKSSPFNNISLVYEPPIRMPPFFRIDNITSTTAIPTTTTTTTTSTDDLIAWNEMSRENQSLSDGYNRLDPPYLLGPETREEPDDENDKVPEIPFEITTTTTTTTNKPTSPNTNEPIGSIDGFVLVNTETYKEGNNDSTTTADTPTSSKPNNKVLIISEDSFDLYSLGGNNTSTELWNIADYDQDDDDDDNDEIEDEFKLKPKPPTDSATINNTATIGPSVVNNNNNNDDTNFENEFTEPMKEVVNVSSAPYGTRISKKLNFTNNKLNDYSSSHQNNHNYYNYNSILNDENKIKGQNNKIPSSTTSTTTTTPAPATCKVNEFQCTNNSLLCVPFESICNRMLDCPDGSDELHCRCADYLARDESQRHKICDGTIDCADLSDETAMSCEPGCRQGMFVCTGPTNQCIEMSKVCDGENDCVNGDDEQNCIALLDDDDDEQEESITSLMQNHNPRGVLHIQHHGRWAPLCFDSYDVYPTEDDSENWIDNYGRSNTNSTATTITPTDGDNQNSSSSSYSISSMIQIDDMGQAVCRANYFAHLEKIEIIKEDFQDETKDDSGAKYFAISSKISSSSKPTLSLWSSLFEKVPCKQRKVARIECSTIECGIRPLSPKLQRRIIGGQSSSFGSWPWQVALYREGEFQCGAVVIDSQWLLTAAHCFYSSPGAYWTARSGVLRRGSLHRTFHEEIRRVDKIFIHPEYVDKGFLNDIAVLRLEKPLRFSKYIRPICLPGADDSQIEKWNQQLCTTVGWGKLYEHGRIFPDTLQEVKLPIISTEECRKRTLFLPLYKITDNMFCAGFEHGGRDACLGDSGGPMMCQKENGKWILLGITSNGDGCGRAGRPGVYTKVYNYLPWIQSILIEGRSGHGRMESEMANNNKTLLKPSCNGHRCPLGKCLKPEQICDQIIDCQEDSSDERNCPRT